MYTPTSPQGGGAILIGRLVLGTYTAPHLTQVPAESLATRAA